MRNPVSSFPADPTLPWYRDRWPLLLIAGPLLVVIASLVSAWIAVKSDDGLVAQDYYKQGLLINQLIRRTAAAPAPEIGATMRLEGEKLRVHLDAIDAAPTTLRVRLGYPSLAGHEDVVTLVQSADGDYVGIAPNASTQRRIVTLESAAWRLPTTTVVGPVVEVRLTSGER